MTSIRKMPSGKFVNLSAIVRTESIPYGIRVYWVSGEDTHFYNDDAEALRKALTNMSPHGGSPWS
jgi:hypothetical protein